jgi:hypothetical protein
VRLPPGYHAALNEGEWATLTVEILKIEADESVLEKEETVTHQYVMAAVQLELTLQEALNGPDGAE